MKLVLLDHHLQKGIIRKLLDKNGLKFSELKPKDIESNLFMYHMGRVKKLGLVEKKDTLYRLTSVGKQYVDRVNLDTIEFRIQPKVITLLALKRADGKWLIIERKHQPFLNAKGFPSGKVHYSERLEDAAQRELREKANISDVSLQLRGNVSLRFVRDKEVINHILAYIFYGEVPDDQAIEHNHKYYFTYWDDEAVISADHVFKGNKEILELLTTEKNFFFRELEFTSDY
jgi:ADP-ribose pyrophosphatase YjhB (NUDIX family)